MKVTFRDIMIPLSIFLMLLAYDRWRYPKDWGIEVPDTNKIDSAKYNSRVNEGFIVEFTKGAHLKFISSDFIIMSNIIRDSIRCLTGDKYSYIRFCGDTVMVYRPKDTITILYSQVANKLHIKPID